MAGSGSSWSVPVRLSNSSRSAGNPFITIQGTGPVHALWQEEGKGKLEHGYWIPGDDDVYYSIFEAGAWSKPVNVSNIPSAFRSGDWTTAPHLAVDDDNRLHVVWPQDADLEAIYYTTCASHCASYDRAGPTPWQQGIAVASMRDVPTDGIGPSSSLEDAREMRMDVVLHYLGWDSIEVGNGVYNWDVMDDVLRQTDAYDLPVALRVYNAPVWRRPPPGDQPTAPPANPDDLREFMYRLADRVENRGWRGRVAGYVIWNEPNILQQWGGQATDAQAYVDLLCAAYEGAKLADPDVRIISAGLAPTETGNGAMNDLDYLARMYDAGLADCVDVVGLHALGFGRPPEDTSPDGYNFRRLEQLHQVMLGKGDTTHQVWALEVGWLRMNDAGAGDGWPGVSETQQADYLEAALGPASAGWRDWLDLIVVWNLDFDRYYGPSSTFHWYAIQNAEAGERLRQEQLRTYLPAVLKD
jgi:hypothetical protein